VISTSRNAGLMGTFMLLCFALFLLLLLLLLTHTHTHTRTPSPHTVMQHICKYFVERAHYIVKVRGSPQKLNTKSKHHHKPPPKPPNTNPQTQQHTKPTPQPNQPKTSTHTENQHTTITTTTITAITTQKSTPKPPNTKPQNQPPKMQAKRYPLIMDFRKGVEQMDRQQLLSLTESVQVCAVIVSCVPFDDFHSQPQQRSPPSNTPADQNPNRPITTN
jgi:hypothetical protein